MKLILLPLLFFFLGFSTPISAISAFPKSQKRKPTSDLRLVHDALFEMLFPIDQIAEDAEKMKILSDVREQLWKKISDRSEALWGFHILDLMSLFKGGFAGRTLQERRQLFHKMEVSSSNTIRKGARYLRLYYLYSIYASDLGQKISGMPRSPISRADMEAFLKANTPQFPKSQFFYNADKGIVSSHQGPLDVIVVGSGPAGSVLAYELSRKGQRVLLLEQGSFAIPDAVDTRRVLSFHESLGMRTSADGGMIFRNGNTVGGGSTINVDLAFSPLLPFIQSRIENWRQKKLIPANQWSSQELQSAYSWVQQHVGTRDATESEMNANNRILWEGTKKIGRNPSLYELNTYTLGKSPSPVINKRSAVSAFILPAMQNPKNPLTVIPGAKALRILWKKEKTKNGTKIAEGIEFEKTPQWRDPGSLPDPHQLNIPDGKIVKVLAKNIIVAAGSLGSPALLLRSDLDNPEIGRAPVAHPSIPLIGLFEQKIKIWEGTPSSVYVADQALSHSTILEAMTADVSYAAMMLPGDSQQIYNIVRNVDHMGGFGVLFIDTPNDKNRITINKNGDPQIQYTLPRQDIPQFSRAVSDAAKIMLKAGAKKIFIPSNELSETEITTEDQAEKVAMQLKFVSNRTTLTSAHLQSSCKMGSDPKKSVVDHNHRVWETQNVYVVDGSVFPSSVGANPMQSIYTIAKIFADRWPLP